MTTGSGANRPSQLESRYAYKAFYDDQGNHYGNHHLDENFGRVKFILDRVRESDVVLEMGCQTGGITRLLSPRVKHIYANEVSGTYQARACEVLEGLSNITLVPGFAEDLATTYAGQCDVVIAMEILEHVIDPAAICQAAKDCMAEDGIALFSVPKGYTDVLGEHVREFNLLSFGSLLRSYFAEVNIIDAGEWFLAETRR